MWHTDWIIYGTTTWCMAMWLQGTVCKCMLIQFDWGYVPFQLIYGYVEIDDDNNDDEIETRPPLQEQGFFYPTTHGDCMRWAHL